MPALNDGSVQITLAGEEKTLTPTLKAITAISARFGGMRKAITALQDRDLQAVAFILQIGLDIDDKAFRAYSGGVGLGETIWREMGSDDGAFGTLIYALIVYLGVLENGGRPLPDQIGEGKAAEGN